MFGHDKFDFVQVINRVMDEEEPGKRKNAVGRSTHGKHSLFFPPLKSLPPTVERKKRRFSCVLIYIVKRSFLRRIPEFKH